MTTSDTCYSLIVAGRLSRTVTQVIDARFGAAAAITVNGTDSRVDLAADQAALRALLTLLWDFGHDLVAIGQCPSESQLLEPFASRPTVGHADSQHSAEAGASGPTTSPRSAHHP
ncbi:MAG TPA: hypothetical protein VF635_05315 [Propionibacteriaceae bacterium]